MLIPKKKSAVLTSDYRPISLVNAIQKLFSKILANRFKSLLQSIIQPTQTGFIKGQQIFQGFHYAQETIETTSTNKKITHAFQSRHTQDF
jgi:Reverse transcriptase (RNA-dependent DNA polymerase)